MHASSVGVDKAEGLKTAPARHSWGHKSVDKPRSSEPDQGQQIVESPPNSESVQQGTSDAQFSYPPVQNSRVEQPKRGKLFGLFPIPEASHRPAMEQGQDTAQIAVAPPPQNRKKFRFRLWTT